MKYFFFFLLFIVSLQLHADTSKLTYKSLAIRKQNRSWWEYVPNGCSNKECPLILAFHSGESSGERFNDEVKLTDFSEEHNFIIVFPNAIHKQWNDGRNETASNNEDLEFVDKLLEELLKLYKIDNHKIFATGLSEGGLFTFRLACERSEFFAAIAPVAANMASDLIGKCNPKRTIPIINFVGTDDKFIPMSGGAVRGRLGLTKKGTVLSTNQTMGFWIKRNKCNPKPNVDKVRDQAKKDSTYAVLEKYEGCEGGADIFRWVIGGGGHTWPSGTVLKRKLLGKVSREVNATEEIWNFFSNHPMKNVPASSPVLAPTKAPPAKPVQR